jgi:hypothetical protein
MVLPDAGGDEMVVLLFFAVLAVMVVCLVGPPRLVRWIRQSVWHASDDPVSPPALSAPDPLSPERPGPAPEEELMEQILTAERLAGILSLEDYQRGMARIAAQDAVNHPMAVPPERL